MRPPKTISTIKQHFKKRLFERYGLVINRNQYQALNQQIQNGKAKFILKQSRDKTHFLVELDAQPVYVVYNKKLGGICTALKLEWLPNSPKPA